MPAKAVILAAGKGARLCPLTPFLPKEMLPVEGLPAIHYILTELVSAGIGSFKIEGRMKTALYVATVARTYRRAIDDLFTSPDLYEENMPWYKSEIGKCTYRQFTTGFYFGKPDDSAQIYDNSTYVVESVFLGIVEEVTGDGRIRLTQKNKFRVGDVIEVMKPDGINSRITVEAITDQDGAAQSSAPHACQVIYVLPRYEAGSPAAEAGDVLRTI